MSTKPKKQRERERERERERKREESDFCLWVGDLSLIPSFDPCRTLSLALALSLSLPLLHCCGMLDGFA